MLADFFSSLLETQETGVYNAQDGEAFVSPVEWGASSVGRALRSQRRGRGFNSPALHQTYFDSSPAAVIRQSRPSLPSLNSVLRRPLSDGARSLSLTLPARAVSTWSCVTVARSSMRVLKRPIAFGRKAATFATCLCWPCPPPLLL